MATANKTPATTSAQAEPVYAFSKNSAEVVRATLSVFKGHHLADLRVWAQRDDGEYVPTRKGLCVNVDLLDELEAAVAALKRAVAEDRDDG